MIARLVVQTIAWLGFMGLLLFGAAGDWRWVQAWVFLATFALGSVAFSVWLWRRDPALLASRVGPLIQRGQPTWDRIFIVAFVPIWCGWVAFMALDAQRWRTSDLSPRLNLLGGMLVVAGFLATAVVLRENSFAAPVIRVQAERSQRVIDTGPYAFVRHPMYAVAVLYLVGIPLLLGSWYGLLVVPLMILGIAARAVFEERLLKRELPGYADYMKRVRYRLLPGVWILALVLAGGASEAATFASHQRIVYSDGLHNENTTMIPSRGRILLGFRGGEQGQIGSARAHINIYESRDRGRTFKLLSEVNANDLPGGRDIRDPKLVEMNGKLFLYAISRVPGFHYRDFAGQAWALRAESTDGGRTWSSPMKTYADVDANGKETYWGFWRYTPRTYTDAGKHRRTLFATGYEDGDIAVGLFASEDGVSWEKRSTIIASYDDVPSEAELQFFGKNHDTAVALVRLDNQDILADGQTAICTAHDPFVTWECGRRIEQRLDGPTWIVRGGRRHPRNFVFARKHLPCTFKRTAIYELRGDLSDPAAPIEVCEIQELKSSGDTAYTSLAPLSRNRALLAWYSSPVDQELPWFEGISSPSDIWLADVDFGRAPRSCTPPPPKHLCEPPPLPANTAAFDVSGSHLLTLAPVIWPAQTLAFRADVQVHGTSLDLALQPLDGVTRAPVGTPWTTTNVALSADGRFTASFATESVPAQAYPLLNDPLLTVHEFVVTGATTSTDGFCGSISGYAQVLLTNPSDRIRLEGSTFGAARITGAVLPAPVSACAAP